jgi:hypothetical protein
MLKHVLAVFGLIVLVAIGIFVWLAWPDQAKLDVNAVAGARPDITAPRQQVIPTVGTANRSRPGSIIRAGCTACPTATCWWPKPTRPRARVAASRIG